MKRPITIAACIAALLAAGLASADTITDRRWFNGPAATATSNDWRAIDSVVECTYGPWEMIVRADGSRVITRTKACTGTETMNLGKLPE